ncbi:MAG: hypothetical protein KC613_25630 [Myxococcales bacterium]|nr:hypothetical protein [Myxococcales bacterium]
MTPRHAVTALLCLLPLGGCDDAAEPEAPIAVRGHAFNFGPPGGGLVGAEIWVLEQPDLRVTTGEGGAFEITDLPPGGEITLVLDGADRPAYQTATFQAEGHDLERFTLQTPTWEIYNLLKAFIRQDLDAEHTCQIASTVTRRGHDLYDGVGTHGEPGATVFLDPPPPESSGPIYFNLITYDTIYPDPALTETTDDGGVLFVNVPPGDYLLRAEKAGATIRPVRIKCRAGLVVNGSPPWGLQVLEGGLEPRAPGDPGPFVPDR